MTKQSNFCNSYRHVHVYHSDVQHIYLEDLTLLWYAVWTSRILGTNYSISLPVVFILIFTFSGHKWSGPLEDTRYWCFAPWSTRKPNICWHLWTQTWFKHDHQCTAEDSSTCFKGEEYLHYNYCLKLIKEIAGNAGY